MQDPIKRLVNIIRVIACGTIASGMSIISHGIRLLQVIGMTFLHTLDFFIEVTASSLTFYIVLLFMFDLKCFFTMSYIQGVS